jgi:hypothetical protein
LIAAYVLFTVAGAAMALTLYSVVTSEPLPTVLVGTDAVTDTMLQVTTTNPVQLFLVQQGYGE